MTTYVRVPEQKKTVKPWGYEILIEHTAKYALKEIYVCKGSRSSLQSHDFKLETILITSGSLELEIVDEEGKSHREIYREGQAYTLSPKLKHRVLALEDVRIIEVSTPELDDVIRYQDDFGRVTR